MMSDGRLFNREKDSDYPTNGDDLAEMLKGMHPFTAAETAIAVQVERMRVAEAHAARDVVVHHLASACQTINDKSAAIERLMREKQDLEDQLASSTSGLQSNGEQNQAPRIAELEEVIKSLRGELKALRGCAAGGEDAPPTYDEGQPQMRPASRECTPDSAAQLARQDALRVLREATINNPSRMPSPLLMPGSPRTPTQDYSGTPDTKIINPSIDPVESIRIRHAILAALPLPPGIPSDALKPIVIPAPYTLQEFLGNAAGPLRTSLSNYRIFQQLTTHWCPDREEHGYFLTPLFKCSTNPRVVTAHRWMMIDVIGKMDRPTDWAECFYNKDGKWYYAGIYKAIRLDDLTTKEWEQLSAETTQAIVKDTIAGRKNSSPQTVYEMTQLYAAGALRVACIGLQCIGFNTALYHAALDQAGTGRWRSPFGNSAAANWATADGVDGGRIGCVG
ncbi:hypothetical protein FA95DRAFT_1597592 [Auriscalpium vulgare]|uniref:Uncharacterized protein n=1 Tax=Auriscalpium vulgare TaxID=40419 RepID=A0ACB8RK96_9AGAM|nr:hypothetical protein FA95DRAFT_1597592 [Auriscalpium vulgare]